jgi:PAS domain S-box-containing protein
VALEYTGLSLDEVRADDFRDRIFHRDDIERLRDGRHKGLSGTVPFENEQRALGKDGRYRWFLIRYNPLLDGEGKVEHWYTTGTDIEDRKRAQQALRNALDQVQKSEARLRQQTIVVLDPLGTPVYANAATLEYSGLSAEDVVAPDFPSATLSPKRS